MNSDHPLERLRRNDATLTSLYLGCANLGDSGAAALAEALAHNSTLTSLNLSSANLGESGAAALAEGLDFNACITSLHGVRSSPLSLELRQQRSGLMRPLLVDMPEALLDARASRGPLWDCLQPVPFVADAPDMDDLGDAEFNANQTPSAEPLVARNEARAEALRRAQAALVSFEELAERLRPQAECVPLHPPPAKLLSVAELEARAEKERQRTEDMRKELETQLQREERAWILLAEAKYAKRKAELCEQLASCAALRDQTQQILWRLERQAEHQDEAATLFERIHAQSRGLKKARRRLRRAKEDADDSDEEADEAVVTEYREAYASAKRELEVSLRRAAQLSRDFPELARAQEDCGVSWMGGSSAVVSLEDFEDLRALQQRSDVFVGRWRGSKWVLKRRELVNSSRKRLEKECYILSRIKHPFIVRMEASFVLSQQHHSYGYLVFPHFQRGTLADEIGLQRDPRSLAAPLIHAVSFLHANGILHRDIKPANVLIKDDGSPLLSDFDVSKDSTFHNTQTTMLNPGTLGYLAPECLRGSCASPSSDIYSLGVTLLQAELHSLAEDFSALPRVENADVRALLAAMLRQEAEKRASADELLAFPLFAITGDQESRLDAFRANLTRLLKHRKRVRCSIKEPLLERATVFFADLQTSSDQHLASLYVEFEGEEGVDAGGLTTSLYVRFLDAATSDPALFDARDTGLVLPCARADDMQMRAVGFVLARALLDERVVPFPVPMLVWRFLWGIEDAPLTLQELEEFDQSQAKMLRQVSLYPLVEYDQDFDEFGEPARAVTAGTRMEYVRKRVHYELIGSRVASLRALRDGFRSLGPLWNLLQSLRPAEARLLVAGRSFLSAAMIVPLLSYENRVPEQIQTWLQETLRSFSSDELRAFLCFITGSPRVPIDGLELRVVRTGAEPDRLPTSHTCFNQIDLGSYSSQQLLAQQLRTAITSGDSYGFA